MKTDRELAVSLFRDAIEDSVKDKYCKIVESFLRYYSNKDIKDFTKDDIFDFVVDKPLRFVTYQSSYKIVLKKFFNVCVEKGLRNDNPVAAISIADDLLLSKRLKCDMLSREEAISICMSRYNERKLIDAFLFYSIYEGLDYDDIAALKKTDVQNDILMIRNGYAFKMDELHTKLTNELKNSDKMFFWNDRMQDYSYYPLIESLYVYRYSGKTAYASNDFDTRKKMITKRFQNAKFGYSKTYIRDSGAITYLHESGISDIENVTKESMEACIKRYNYSSMKKFYDMLRENI